jgi:TolB protein
MTNRILIAAALIGAAACERSTPVIVPGEAGETRLANIKQVTFGGENAEAYFSADGRWITFQSTRDGRACDQQYVMRSDGSGLRRISDGRGKTTCGWFIPGTDRVLFGSSTAHDAACPARPDPSQGYVWPLDKYDIYSVKRDGTDLQRLTHFDVYTAESVISPDGKRVVFTSVKDGDLDIYTMNVDGTDIRRLTDTPGYDGGAWWSPDGTKLVYRANHPATVTELEAYRELLNAGMVRPSRVELWVMDADGGNKRQVTALGGANFGPSWSPDGTKIIFSSNFVAPRSGNFELYLVDASETMASAEKLERVTTSATFDGFPMFSPDGTRLIWASNRHARTEGETNLFIADFRWDSAGR